LSSLYRNEKSVIVVRLGSQQRRGQKAAHIFDIIYVIYSAQGLQQAVVQPANDNAMH